MLNVTTAAVEQVYEAGVEHHAAGRFREAETCWRQVLGQNPMHVEAVVGLGVMYLRQNRVAEAIGLWREASGRYADASVLCHLGVALHIRGQLEGPGGAAESLERSLSAGESALAHFHLGAIFITTNRVREAIEHLRRAVVISPAFPDALRMLSMALQLEGRISESLEVSRRAVELQGSAEDLSMLGSAQAMAGRIPQAMESFRKAIGGGGGQATAAIHSAMLLVAHYLGVLEPPALFAEHRAWNERHAKPLAKRISGHKNGREPERRIRVGYVSADLRNHPVGKLMEPILVGHDRKKVEVFCYSAGAVEDVVTERLKVAVCENWRTITFLSDEAAEEMVRKDQIDILVDLGGHTTANRLLVFARKPAPVQVTYLGYPNTTGMEAMDYRLTDGIADPPGLTDHLHSEKLVRLGGAECFLCFRAPGDAPLVGTAPAKVNGYITFGSFNLFPKISPGVVEVWAEILRKLPTARLVLKNSGLGDAGLRQLLLERFADLGVAAGRLELRGRVEGHAEHLEMYNRVDIGLDTFPYQGTMTTCEALFMGVPVIMLAGQTHVSRVGASILSRLNLGAMGLPELVAATGEQYVDIAVRLANDGFRRGKFRAVLRERMLGSVLMDERRFVEGLEEAYRGMWRAWCAGQASG